MMHLLERLSWIGGVSAAMVAASIETGLPSPPETQSVREWVLIALVLFVLAGFGYMIRQGFALFQDALKANKAHADATAKLADAVRDLREDIRSKR